MLHCWSSLDESLCYAAGRLGLECEDDFSSPMQVGFVPTPAIFVSFSGSELLAV